MALSKLRWFTRPTKSKKFAFFDNFIPTKFARHKNGSAWRVVYADIVWGSEPPPPVGGFKAAWVSQSSRVRGAGVL